MSKVEPASGNEIALRRTPRTERVEVTIGNRMWEFITTDDVEYYVSVQRGVNGFRVLKYDQRTRRETLCAKFSDNHNYAVFYMLI